MLNQIIEVDETDIRNKGAQSSVSETATEISVIDDDAD